ncbi:methyl-viologen-reducing hydrogenase subunit del ta [Desulfonema ishimotonii]|uniref:Methyl-viologen-reducing hydrogenase subunit del ta n=1 Tax=Desulfonema ishimotonii TaxID=45657 RepID=A0A401G126_9BACT|nr:methyl-viologen-reducing hydrogenase subunit del ta [Desulfonema ishimotonii]
MTGLPQAAVQEEGAFVEAPHKIPPGWEPNVLAIACHYCAFAAADLAGVMRLSYSPNVKIIRLPCTGKLDHSYVLRAFERGVDGLFVAG